MAAAGIANEGQVLQGRRVCAVSLGANFLTGILAGLAQDGAEISLLTDVASDVKGAAKIDTQSSQAVCAAIDAAVAQGGVPDLIVLSVAPAEAARIAPLADMSPADWRAGVHRGLRTTLWLLQAWGRHLKPRGGAIVFVAPSLSLVGGADLIALTTLLEGQRGLIKSVARQWGASGVTLNWIAAAPRALSPHFDGARLAAKPDAVSVALGRPADPARDIVPVLSFLAGPGGRAITGATIPLDGGEWMIP